MTTTRAAICILFCIWLEICITLTDARGGGRGGGSVSRGSSFTSSTSTSTSTSSGLGGGGSSTSTYTSTSSGVGVGVGSASRGAGLGGGGRGFPFFFGSSSSHARANNTDNNDNDGEDDEEEMPLVWKILFWVAIGLFGLCACFSCAYCYSRNPEYQKSRFSSRVANAKNQVKSQGFKNRNHDNMGRPPPTGTYVATYTIKGEEFSNKTTLSFSPNLQDSNTSWLISGRCKNTNMAMGENVNACREFTITEGVIAESGHAYWVQQHQEGGGNDRSLTTGKFEFDGQSASNWCSFTGSIMTHKGEKSQYTSFQLEKDCVVHVSCTTDLESNEG